MNNNVFQTDTNININRKCTIHFSKIACQEKNKTVILASIVVTNYELQ